VLRCFALILVEDKVAKRVEDLAAPVGFDRLHHMWMVADHKICASVDRCMYDMTPDEDFILDALPDAGQIIIGSGFSGHGFKFGTLIGELLAALALEQPTEFPLEGFRLSRFGQSAVAQ